MAKFCDRKLKYAMKNMFLKSGLRTCLYRVSRDMARATCVGVIPRASFVLVGRIVFLVAGLELDTVDVECVDTGSLTGCVFE